MSHFNGPGVTSSIGDQSADRCVPGRSGQRRARLSGALCGVYDLRSSRHSGDPAGGRGRLAAFVTPAYISWQHVLWPTHPEDAVAGARTTAQSPPPGPRSSLNLCQTSTLSTAAVPTRRSGGSTSAGRNGHSPARCTRPKRVIVRTPRPRRQPIHVGSLLSRAGLSLGSGLVPSVRGVPVVSTAGASRGVLRPGHARMRARSVRC